MRLWITLGIIAVALGVVTAVFMNPGGGGRVATPPAAPSAGEATPGAEREAAPTATPGTAEAPAAPDAPSPPAAALPTAGATAAAAPDANFPPIPGLRPRFADPTPSAAIGAPDLANDAGYFLQAQLTSAGAAVESIKLTRYHQDLTETQPYVVQKTVQGARLPDGRREFAYPFAARAVEINGTRVGLSHGYWTRLDEPGAFAVDVVDEAGSTVARVERRYRIAPGSYEVILDQRVVNRSGRPLRVRWEQFAQGDMPEDGAAYMGDRRDLVTGYFDAPRDPKRRFVYSVASYVHRTSVLGEVEDRGAGSFPTLPLWPNDHLPDGAELVWVGQLNRYFGAVAHLPVDAGQPPADAALSTLYPNPVLTVIGRKEGDKDHRGTLVTLRSVAVDVPAGEAASFPLAVFTGPRKTEVFADPAMPYAALGFEGLVYYSLGGPCGFFTFQTLAHGLLYFLKGIHFVVRDWGIAIIVLVLVVRLVLHPITKKSQVGMMRMGKQMQALQPEIEKLKKKYKDDQQSLNREMMALYREKGVNPANMLGCLPMFLQMPIWFALYAMLYFAIELRHQPAFYGVFNHIASLWGGSWHFLADLSSADHFIMFFDEPRDISLFFITVNFQALNILPILWAVVLFLQQHYLAPPAANEQAAQTQKMMKWMTFIFPVFLYSAPSGLTLYILASTAAGILDSYLVRRHVKHLEALEAAGVGVAPTSAAAPKKTGLMARFTAALEERQRQMQQQQQNKGTPSYKQRKKR